MKNKLLPNTNVQKCVFYVAIGYHQPFCFQAGVF